MNTTAREDVRAVALAHQAEIEDLYQRRLADLPEGHSVTMNDLQNPSVVAVLGEVESAAWNRTVEGIWLDACLARGFGYHSPQPETRTPPTPRTAEGIRRYSCGVATVEREDDLPDDAYQRREVFAHYGAAMFFAQVLEQGLVNALTFAQTATTPGSTQSTFDLNFDGNLRVTTGRLLHRIKPFLGDDTDLVDALTSALELRNRFAHTYWVEHDRNFFSFSCREVMMAEAIQAQTTFQQVDSRLNPVLARYLQSVGLTREQLDSYIAEEFESLRAEAESRDMQPG